MKASKKKNKTVYYDTEALILLVLKNLAKRLKEPEIPGRTETIQNHRV